MRVGMSAALGSMDTQRHGCLANQKVRRGGLPVGEDASINVDPKSHTELPKLGGNTESYRSTTPGIVVHHQDVKIGGFSSTERGPKEVKLDPVWHDEPKLNLSDEDGSPVVRCASDRAPP